MKTTYSIHIISEKGTGCYLSVRGKTEWRTKQSAINHALDIIGCKARLFDAFIVEVEDNFGFPVKTYKRG